MRFFANSQINWLYFHSALHSFSEYAGGLFIFAFLLKAGIRMEYVFLSLAVMVLARLVVRQFALPFAVRFGLRATLIFGNSVSALSFLLLGFVKDVGPLLLVYLLITGVGEAFYWACYHATTARLGDKEARGAQVSAVQLIYAVNIILGPVIGGFAQVWVGGVVAFVLAGIIRALGALPLLKMSKLSIAPKFALPPATKRFAFSIYFCDGFSATGASTSFNLALFIVVGQNFQAFGVTIALAALFGALAALAIGRLFDLGHHKWSNAIGIVALLIFEVSAAFGYAQTTTAIAALAVAAVAGPLYSSAYNARIYNIAKASGDALRFHVTGEGGWDLGSASSACIAAGFIWLGLGLGACISLGVLGTLGVGWFLGHSYVKDDPSFLV